MQHFAFRKDSVGAIAAYLGATALCVLILVWVLQLWDADMAVPFAWGWDALFTGMMVKTLIDNPWYLHNSFVGMPTGLDMHDYPMADNLHFLVLKLISCFSDDYAIVLNTYFLLTFPLTTLSSLFVFRHFNIPLVPAVVGSLLFTFVPHHILRGEGHLFLAAYYLIPLIIMVMLWIFHNPPPLPYLPRSTGEARQSLFASRTIASIVICLLTASAGVYYAFFACYLLLVAGLSAAISRRRIHHFITATVLVAVISIGVIANLSPSLIYQYRHGKNPMRPIRDPGHAEIWGLRITALLLPLKNHRIPKLAKIRSKYDRSIPFNAGTTATLGIIGSVGFLILIGKLLIYRRTESDSEILSSLSILNIFAVLLGTIGGFGSIFAVRISPQIRGYDRVSIFIAFFSIFASILLLHKLSSKINTARHYSLIYNSTFFLLLFMGILDQTTKDIVFPYSRLKSIYTNDSKMIQTIESVLPPRTMIYQLPYVPFPEHPPVHNMQDYELFTGYLHSKSLRWSYGAIKGRETDSWQQELSTRPLPELIEAVKTAGFGGIYLDRNGFADRGGELEANLTGLLGRKPLVSEDNRLVFFALPESDGKQATAEQK